MGAQQTVLLLGATGRTGGRVLQQLVDAGAAVISCLGHVTSLKGVFGPPRDLVTRATARLCRAIQAVRAATPVRFILMSSVSVNRPRGLDTRRGAFDTSFMWALCRIVPAAQDNQSAADFLGREVGAADPFVQWVAVRPDTLLEGDVTEYALHEGLVTALFKPASTNMANVAHFMCALDTAAPLWGAWKGKLPVIINAAVR